MSKILLKYNRPGPRYTSYPPATFFHTGFSTDDYKKALIRSNEEKPNAISIYLHVPFCPRQCHFCGCNTSIAKETNHIDRYMKAMIKEIHSVAELIDKKRLVTQIHWGGGTPNSIPLSYISDVMNTLKSHFTIAENAEIAIECNPAYIEYEHIDSLANDGFNRISLGVQDFDADVLHAINRLPSKLPLKDLMQYARSKGIKSINIDLVYGLPKQNNASFADAINKAIDLKPDRLVTFSYAHVPWFNAAMKKLEEYGLPTTEQKFEMFELAYNKLSTSGYIPIGLDHYALPEDDLSLAMNEKKLHRNFQGYCTRETTGQVYAFGASAIGQMWSAYSQNVKSYEKYIELIETTGFAIERGYLMTKTDLMTRETINAVMCNGYLNFDDIANQFDMTVDEMKSTLHFSPEKLTEFIEDDVLTLNGNCLSISREGMLIVRNIAMAFDPQLETKQGMYSKTI